MAQPQLLQIKLSRCDAQPWGFRLQGGVDFAQPLLVQKVNASSLSEQAGMQPGDAVIKINDVDVFNLRHKDAQDIVVRSGNNFVITVQRGGTTWRPHVTPTGNMPQANSPHLQTVTKTSLAHHQPDSQHIGCGYNNSARPFDNGGSDSGVKSIVNKQYNSPVGIYSDESIAETLSAQAEVLAGGVLGVNFKKNEKEYQGDRSEVLKFLREEETEQSTPAFNNNHSSNEHDAPQQQHLQQHHNEQQRHQKQHQHYSHQQQQSNTNSATRHVSAPINTPKPPSTGGLPSGQNICTECERLITGVFVRIKDKNLHVECFKCATCGTSLKNQGYYNFNNKLYCEIHAKQAAQQHPPAGTEGYVPVPIKPNTKLSATTISSALNYHCFGSNGYNGANGNSSSAPAPVNQGYARPYGASQPPVAAPKSPVPVSYPPQHQHQSSYATLPRSNVCQQESEEERLQPEFGEECSYEVDADVAMAVSRRSHGSSFSWPPPQDESHAAPTAVPLYIAPPETQHVVVTNPIQDVPPLPPVSAVLCSQKQPQAQQNVQQQWQSYSTPQLTNQPMQQESCSDSYTSTSTTTTTTSEEYQRIYAANLQDYQLECGTGQDIHEYLSGRRSAQECVDSLSAPLSTYKLVDMVREVTPCPIPYPEPAAAPLTARHVVFNDEPEINELHEGLETVPESFAVADQLVQLKSDADSDQSADCENLIIERHRSQILKSERKFQATPEINFILGPVRPRPAPSKIHNSSPKEWINPTIRVLTTAPDVPFHLVECPFPKPCGDDFTATAAVVPALDSAPTPASIDNYTSELLSESPPQDTSLSQAMKTAPEFEMHFALPGSEDVRLPEETVPYLPPPIDMKPYLREDYRPKSPFVSALTTAPERPFEGHFDKDVPIHELDLPTPKEHLSMCYALCTAPDRGYTPLNPDNATQRFDDEQKLKYLKKAEFQVLDHEEELGIKPLLSDNFEYNTAKSKKQNQHQRKSSAFAAVQAFQPSREPLSSSANSSNTITNTPSVSFHSTEQSDLEYQKYCKAQQRNQKRLDYFHQKEEELQVQQQQVPNSTQHPLDTNLRSLLNASNATSSSNISSSVQKSTTNSTATNSNPAEHGACKIDANKIIEEVADEFEHFEAHFPPPSPLSHLKGKAVQSGLHRADTIPKYQRNWTVLPTQSPVRTPEPQELRDNVPLAFVDSLKSLAIGDIVHRPLAKDSRGVQSSEMAPTAAPCSVACVVNSTVQPLVPINVEDRPGPVTMAFQSLDEYDHADQSITPERQYTTLCSSVINKPAPIVPFYQTEEKLCFDECPATHARAYDQQTASPFPDRARSPAPGPPPNPLSSIRAPRMKEPDFALPSVGGPPRLLAGSITTGQSYQSQLVAHQELSSQSANQDRIGNINVQQREQSLQLQQQSQIQSQTKTQIGNTQIAHRRQVTEEYDQTQSAKTIEIRLGSQSQSRPKSQSQSQINLLESIERRQSYGRTGFVANQARRLSGLEQEISGMTSQSQFISDRVPILGVNTFPQLRSPTFESKFPVNTSTAETVTPNHPSGLPTASNKQRGPPPGFLQQQQLKQQQCKQQHKSDFKTESSELFESQQEQCSHANATLLASAPAITSASSSASKPAQANLTNASAITTTTNNQACSAFRVEGASIGVSNSNNNISAALVNLPIKNCQQPNASIVASTAAEAISMPTAPAILPPDQSNLNANVDGSTGAGFKGGAFGATSAPKRGRGILNKAAGPGVRIPLCNSCTVQIRGPFITALGRIWCPDHFICVNGNCRRPLQDIGFVEEKGDLYCEYCFEKFLAPSCSKCARKIKGDCLNAIGKHFHPECFTCGQCGKIFGNTPFFLEDGNAYCEADWNELFTTKCFACGFPVEAGDRWVEALSHNYHSQCFNCTFCKQNLEGQSFYNKGGRPFCKNHAR